MLQSVFHAWERKLASVTKDRMVRPFDWGLDWMPPDAAPTGASPPNVLGGWVSEVMRNTDGFFFAPPTSDYQVRSTADNEQEVTFPSALETPHTANNTVVCRFFPESSVVSGFRRTASEQAPSTRGPAVLVLPQWNADPGGHVGLCRLLSWNGMNAMRLTLPYHDRRMPPEIHRADYIVSANVGRTLQICRQAVLDARRAVGWLAREGYGPIGILGTSLGSCLSLLTTAHEPLIRAQALNHISPYFADVVWRGLSTRHVRDGLNGHIDLELLRELWKPISPRWYLDRLCDRRTLLVYAKYDLTFPVDLSKELVRHFRERRVPFELSVLPCGHYSTGKTPFKYVDGWVLTRFLKKALVGSRLSAVGSRPGRMPASSL